MIAKIIAGIILLLVLSTWVVVLVKTYSSTIPDNHSFLDYLNIQKGLEGQVPIPLPKKCSCLENACGNLSCMDTNNCNPIIQACIEHNNEKCKCYA